MTLECPFWTLCRLILPERSSSASTVRVSFFGREHIGETHNASLGESRGVLHKGVSDAEGEALVAQTREWSFPKIQTI